MPRGAAAGLEAVASRVAYLALGVIVIVAIAAAAVYVAQRGAGAAAHTSTSTTVSGAATVSAPTRTAGSAKPRPLLVYVYKGFMAWGSNPHLFQDLVKNFTRETGIPVKLRVFDSAHEMITTAIAEARAGKRTADVIIGVDQITVHELRQAGLLGCYVSREADQRLVPLLDPEKCVTPLDYGVIALVYDPSRLSKEQLAMLRDGVTPEELVKLAPYIVAEDPTKSSTGLNFLLYTIAVSKASGVDWKKLWEEMKQNNLMIAKSWGAAYDEFYRKGSKRAIVVSYGTDPAYSAWYNMRHGKPMRPDVNATFLALPNGTTVGWLQVEGVAVLKGAPMGEAERFVDWLLSPEVQSRIPGSQWMFPANPSVKLPSYYRYALTLGEARLVGNRLLPPNVVASKLSQWLNGWLKVMSGG